MKLKVLLLLFWVSYTVIFSQNLTDVKICINPGHGGYDSDDRNVVIAPYKSADPNGFWESKSNLDKGQQLRAMLEAAGATVIMTRTTNTTADDLPLSQIVAMANQANVDFMLSIHSNAGNGVANHVLMLHVGVDPTDSQVYNTFNPGNPVHKDLSDRSRNISTEIAKNIYSNQITMWSSGYSVRGDKTFARLAMGWSDGYGVLRALYVPGVISEGAMHDYIPETYRLMNMEYKWLEAWYFFKSFSNYFKGGNIPKGVIAGSVRDSRIKLETTYNKFKGRDEMLPVNSAKVTLIETGEEYKVDDMQNGVFLFKNLTPGVYNIRAEKDGYYAQSQQITVSEHNVSFYNFSLNRVRNTPPQVVNWWPNVVETDSVDASTTILFEFNWDMDEVTTAAAFSITPHVSGKITFEDSQYKMRFTPDKPFDKSTIYTVTLKKTASHPDNLSMTEDFSFSFLTKNRNRLALIASYPYDGSTGVYFKSPAFRLIFDKKLNTSNISTTIKVIDETNTVLAKATRSVVNNSIIAPYGSSYFSLSQNLVSGKEYTLVVESDLMDIDGLKVVEPVQIKFKTADVAKNLPDVVDTFESVRLAYIPSESSGTETAGVTTSTTKLFDNYSNKITANFSSPQGSALFGFLQPLVVSKDKVIGLHLFGDLTGNEFSLQLSVPGMVRYVKLCNLNFYGWEFHEVDLSSLPNPAEWTLTGFKIERKNDFLFSANSEILLENMLLYDKPVLSVKNYNSESISIYPNPTSAFIHVKGTFGVLPWLKLYSLNGMLIRETVDDKIFAGDILSGTYILKVRYNQKILTFPVFITH